MVNRTFYVSNDTGARDYTPDEYDKPPRLYRYDRNSDYIVLSTEPTGKKKPKPPPGAAEINATFSLLMDKISAFPSGNWDFGLILRCMTPDPDVNLDIYAYNFDLDRFEKIESFTVPNDWYNVTLSLPDKYVREDGYVLVRLCTSGPLIHSLYLDELMLRATYSYSHGVNCSIFKPSKDQLRERDGDVLPASPLIDVEINNVTYNGTLRSFIGFITLGNSHSRKSRTALIEVYNYTKGGWDCKNTTELGPYEELRIRVPLTEDYISPDNTVRLRIEATVGGGNIVVDEAVVEATWTDVSGGAITIKNESPYVSRIVRIWYIGNSSATYQDFSPPLALRPGETYTIVLPVGTNYVKVVTDYGNIFAFYPTD